MASAAILPASQIVSLATSAVPGISKAAAKEFASTLAKTASAGLTAKNVADALKFVGEVAGGMRQKSNGSGQSNARAKAQASKNQFRQQQQSKRSGPRTSRTSRILPTEEISAPPIPTYLVENTWPGYTSMPWKGTEIIGPIVAHQTTLDYQWYTLKLDLLPVANYMSKLWQHFRFEELEISYVGIQPEDTVGYIALVPLYGAAYANLAVQGFDSVTAADGVAWGPVKDGSGRIRLKYDCKRLHQDRPWSDCTQEGQLVFGPQNYPGSLLIVYDNVYLNGHTGDLEIGNIQVSYKLRFEHRSPFFAPTEYLKNSDYIDPKVAGQVDESAGHPVGGGQAIKAVVKTDLNVNGQPIQHGEVVGRKLMSPDSASAAKEAIAKKLYNSMRGPSFKGGDNIVPKLVNAVESNSDLQTQIDALRDLAFDRRSFEEELPALQLWLEQRQASPGAAPAA